MAAKKEKQERINAEYNRLRRLLKQIPEDKLKAAEGIIRRAAFMRITLEDLETDITEHGTVEMFSQTPGVEYERERPATRIYNTTIKNYTTVCKQLFDLFPDEKPKSVSDELMEFVKGAKK